MVIRRRRIEGELAVEQTRDLARAAALIAAQGMTIEGLEWPAGCYLMAWLGSEPAGVVGVEAIVDAALMRSLVVVKPLRARGIGAALVAAARIAAHTRGARRLYALTCGNAGDYLKRFGFTTAAIEEVIDSLTGTFTVDYLRARPGDLIRRSPLCLDISRDGLIER
ncbi:MAG: GNAT family N-acetyltransferase [Candidatus Binataceae bacterium]